MTRKGVPCPIAAACFAGGLVLGGALMRFCAPQSQVYPRTAIVSSIENDAVVVTDSVGFDWVFSGSEDYMIGDVVSLVMDDNRTPDSILDDKIVDVLYSGFTAKDLP